MAYRYERNSRKVQGDFLMLELVGLPMGLVSVARGETQLLMVDNNLETLQMVQENMQEIIRNLSLFRNGKVQGRIGRISGKSDG